MPGDEDLLVNAKIRHYEPSLVMNRFGSYCEQADTEKEHCGYRLQVAVLERQAGLSHLPRVVHIDGETARILQPADLADATAKVSRPAVAGTRSSTCRADADGFDDIKS